MLLDKAERRCNVKEPGKLVNDLLSSLYDDEFMSAHTLTGLSCKDGTKKEKLDPAVVNKIIGKMNFTLQHGFHVYLNVAMLHDAVKYQLLISCICICATVL